MSILLRSDGCEALFAGDVLHNPLQVARPNWSSMFCADPNEARHTRLRMLDLAVERRLTWFSSHCASPSVGAVARVGDRFTWSFF
jgi:glyoxylase-like metal-dependent hydrolase (beta-lactamase superfamily II)